MHFILYMLQNGNLIGLEIKQKPVQLPESHEL